MFPHSDLITMLYNISIVSNSISQKRWRLAYFSVTFSNSMLSISKGIVSRKAQKRWRLAYIYVHFSNTMLAVSKQKKQRQTIPEIRVSPSHTVVNISPSMDPQDCSGEKQRQPSPGFLDGTDIVQKQLTSLVKTKDLDKLRKLGGVPCLADSLGTDFQKGISGEDVNRRQMLFGSNTYGKQPPKGFVYFIVDKAFKDVKILTLLAYAALLLAFGISDEHGAAEGWYDRGSIFSFCWLARLFRLALGRSFHGHHRSHFEGLCSSFAWLSDPRTWYGGWMVRLLAVFLVIALYSVSNYIQGRRKFHDLSKISNNTHIDVVREGRRQKVSIFDVVVGDVVFLNNGDQIPADGLFIDNEGCSLLVNESSMTGESEHIEVNATQNPFLYSGSKVADGCGQMLVLSVGMNTSWGEVMSSITNGSREGTPLQQRLDKLTSSIGKVGLAVGFLFLAVLSIRYFTGDTQDKNGFQDYNGKSMKTADIINSIIRIFWLVVTIVAVAIPEGLPLAVTLTLAYSMKQMISNQAKVRKLSACETMGSATVICTDKTGTLTMNKMTVKKFWLGLDPIEEDPSSKISPGVLELLHQGVALNTTGSVFKSESASTPEFTGSPTEKAILSWGVMDLGMDMEKLKQNSTILHVETFNSEKKRSGVSVKTKKGNNDNIIHMHWKGAAEMILAMCTKYYRSNGDVDSISRNERAQFENMIQEMAESSLRCIAFAHKQIVQPDIDNMFATNHSVLEENRFILLGIIGLKDPCRPGAKKAIETCRGAGVDVKMITGDNVFTAKAIAAECGILERGQQVISKGEVIEGHEFRNYTDAERMQKVDSIRVMARSSPSDKLLMVQCLKQKGHVVAVIGDGMNDAPALKEADIGLSMDIQGTEVAEESSDIVILNDDFSSVAKVLRWGRCVYNNIQKFIQFQLTMNVAALVINFIATASTGDVPLTTVQLLWVNLIMDTLGALALATERPTDELMDKPPVGRVDQPLITNIMWRNIWAQALYQIALLLTFQFRGKSIFNVNEGVKNTLIFNTFVLCQVFNEFNAREPEKRDVFKGLCKNRLFLGIIGMTVLLQIVMVEFLKKFADTENLNVQQWVICVAFAAFTWPLGWCVKLIPVPKKPIFSYLRR